MSVRAIQERRRRQPTVWHHGGIRAQRVRKLSRRGVPRFAPTTNPGSALDHLKSYLCNPVYSPVTALPPALRSPSTHKILVGQFELYGTLITGIAGAIARIEREART